MVNIQYRKIKIEYLKWWEWIFVQLFRQFLMIVTGIIYLIPFFNILLERYTLKRDIDTIQDLILTEYKIRNKDSKND